MVDLNLPTPGQAPNWGSQLNNEIEKLNAGKVNTGDTAFVGSTPFINISNHGTAATIHLTGGDQERPYILGIGNDAGSSPGLLVANKANGHGMYLDNHPTATQAGFFGAKRSSARLMHLVATTPATMPILELQVQPGVSENRAQPILRVMDGNGVVATFNRGASEFYKNVLVNAPQTLFSNPVSTPNSERSGVFAHPQGFVFKTTAGSSTSWFNTRIHAEGGTLSLDSGGEWGFNIGGNFNRVVAITATTRLGFYGATPVAKQTGVATTAAAVHAALVNLGLISA